MLRLWLHKNFPVNLSWKRAIVIKKEITKDEINELPKARFSGKIHLITQRDDYLRAIDALARERVLGFDTETRPAFKKGQEYKISLLQLSTKEDAYLFRLNKYSFENELRDLLADSGIVKTGVAVRDDIRGLRKLNPFSPGNFVEIANLGKKLEIKQLGLRSLAAIVLGVQISKQFKLTNWEKQDLNEDQLRYAATDAWIGLSLYEKLNELLQTEANVI
jgi:ribonuclease D